MRKYLNQIAISWARCVVSQIAKSLEADWKHLAWQYGIDMFVTGHVHRQDVLEQWDWRNQFKPTELWPNQSHSIKGTALVVLKLNGERILP